MPSPIRAIPLGTSECVEVTERERVAHQPRYYEQLGRVVYPVRAFAEAHERIGGTFDPVREQPAVNWAAERGVMLLHVEPDDVIAWPDAVNLDVGATVEIKKMDEATWTSFRNQVRDAGYQSRHVLIDAGGFGVTPEQAETWLRRVIPSDDGQYLDQVVVILDGPGTVPVEWSRVRHPGAVRRKPGR